MVNAVAVLPRACCIYLFHCRQLPERCKHLPEGKRVTLFTPDKHQFQTHPDITLEDTQLPLERCPKMLGVIMDPSLSFHKHCNYVSDRIDKRNKMLKALAGSSWGQEKETTSDLQRSGDFYRKLCSTSCCCCCSSFSLVHLSLLLLPREIRVPGLRLLVCSISPTVSLSLDELGN